jgi:PAS domain S-box-containing protein/putative nucleotidyltransferase with HDIG domain
VSTISPWFQSNLDIIFFFYGLAFVVMGIAILAQSKQGTDYKIGHVLWLLAVFGLLHGANEFLDMWTIIKGRSMYLDSVRAPLLVFSFLFLFEFGRRLFRIVALNFSSGRTVLRLFGWWISHGIGISILILGFFSEDSWAFSNMWGRYLLGFPGALMSGFGLFIYYMYERERLEALKVKRYFVSAALALLSYGTLSGLVVPKAIFFPANWLNQEAFLSFVGLPVQIFRAMSAVIITLGIYGILAIFDWEVTGQLRTEIAQRVKAEEELRRQHGHLESLVEERTTELTKIAERVQQETERRSEMHEELETKALLLDSATDSIVVHDLSGNFVYLNETACKSRGYTREELMAMNLHDLDTPEHGKLIEPRTRQLLGTGEATFESAEFRKDGSIMPLEVHARVIESGGKRLVLNVCRDISDRKRAEQALQEAEGKFRDFAERSFVGVYIMQDGRLKYANRKLAEFFGCTIEEISNAEVKNLVFPEDWPLVEENLGKHMSGELQSPRYEFRGITRKNQLIYLEAFGSQTMYQRRPAVIGALLDITNHRQAQEELLKFKLGIERSGEAIFLTDIDGAIVYVNPTFERLYGYSREEALGRTPRILKSGTHPQEYYKRFWDKLLAKEDVIGEITNKTKDGRLLTIEGSANPILDKDNNIVGFLAIQRDATARKRAEEELKIEAQLLDAATDSITVHDLEGNFLYVNEATCKLHGYNKDEFLKIHLHKLDTPESARLIGPRIEGLMGTGEATFESDHFRKDGSVMPVEVRARVVEFGAQKVILSVARDVTERKRAEAEVQDSLVKLREALGGIIEVVALTVETKDPYTAGHQRRVADLARAIAQEMGLSSEQVGGIRMAGVIHDIGKISIPSEILTKPGKISDLELTLIRNHPQIGYDILKTIEFPWPIARIILQHHERMDGSGYPAGLSGDDILMESRILAVADVVEAMASHRPYRPALGVGEALKEITRHRGTLYDPGVVDACLRLFREKGFEFEDYAKWESLYALSKG